MIDIYVIHVVERAFGGGGCGSGGLGVGNSCEYAEDVGRGVGE